MSLQGMVTGYSGAIGAFEGVSAEDLAKYNEINGPITMAMEAAELYNDAFMEGFYGVNELQVEAAFESTTIGGSYSSVMEGERLDKLKDKVKAAGHKIAELFRKMGRAIRAFFSNVATKLTRKSTDAEKAIAKSDKKELVYFGYEYTHLEEIKDIIRNCAPAEIFGKIKSYSKIVDGYKGDPDHDYSSSEIMNECTDALKDYKKKFGIMDANDDEGLKLRGYFRKGEISNANKQQKISKSTALATLKAGAKISKDLDSVSKKIESDFEKYAKKADELAVKNDETEGSNADLTSAWMGVAGAARAANTFITKLLSTWTSAYTEAASAWVKAAGGKLESDDENKDDKK